MYAMIIFIQMFDAFKYLNEIRMDRDVKYEK